MRQVLSWAVVAAAATALAGAASAADIRQPPPAVKAPAFVAPLFTWTGFYIGGNLGYGWSDRSGTFTIAPARGPVSGEADGIIGGVQVGYNWQMGAFVIGIETDFQGSGIEGNVSGRLVPGPVAVNGKISNEWFGTIRGRLGYAVDRWLFYFTGGGAYSHTKFSGVAGGVPFSSASTGWSWTVGGGVETALAANWSIKGEYLYIAKPDNLPVPAGTRFSGDIDSHVIRLGVNYRF
jgi:outer membrane immunogenic protein